MHLIWICRFHILPEQYILLLKISIYGIKLFIIIHCFPQNIQTKYLLPMPNLLLQRVTATVGEYLKSTFKDSLITISHGGTINGFNSIIVRIINSRDLIVLLNNTGLTVLPEISNKIIDNTI
jgi:hypothetical protein